MVHCAPSLAQASVAVQFVVTATDTIVNEAYGVRAAGGIGARNAVTTIILPAGPLLAIDKTGPIVAAAREPFTYTLTVRNGGVLTATNLVITDAAA
ncbi:MAG: hypothetical protein R3E31_17325 [Chloroflexota bacterium]